jgi:hypothetical protein
METRPLLVVDSQPPTTRSSMQADAKAILDLLKALKTIRGFTLWGPESLVFPEMVCKLLDLMALRFLRVTAFSRVACID